MKHLFFMAVLCCLFSGIFSAEAKPPCPNGEYIYDITVVDEAGNPIPEVVVMRDNAGTVTDAKGHAFFLTAPVMTLNDVLEIRQKGYLAERITFSEESDGKAVVVLKADPRASRPKAKTKPAKKSKQKND